MYLCLAPKRVYVACFTYRAVTDLCRRYRNVYFHKRALCMFRCLSKVLIEYTETKNTWARDDPAILILIAGCLTGPYPITTLFRRLTFCFHFSRRNSLVHSMAPHPRLSTQSRRPDDHPRLSPRRRLTRYSPLGIRQSRSVVASITYFDQRRERGMGVRVRRAYQCVLPVLLDALRRATVFVADIAKDELGVLVDWEYVVSCRVSLNVFSTTQLQLMCRWQRRTIYLWPIPRLQRYAPITIFNTSLCTNVQTALPFLIRTEFLLAPLLPTAVGYILSLLGFNFARHALQLYFGSL